MNRTCQIHHLQMLNLILFRHFGSVSFIVRPLPTLKETTKGFFIEGRAVADRSAASFTREA